MRNLKLIISYDGTRFRGWQRLSGTDQTIQGKLENALTRILEEPIEVIGSGRTDAGVHATGQVANFHCRNPLPCQQILSQLRRFLPDSIGVLSCTEASERFHARYNARRKTYVYRVWNSEEPCVFIRHQVYRMPQPLDLAAMQRTAEFLIGTHDFRSFCSNKNYKKSTIRTLEACRIVRHGNEIRFTLTADGFLYNMVRILVGTLLETGMSGHDLSPEDIPGIFEKGNRSLAGYTVPAQGLTLMEVEY